MEQECEHNFLERRGGSETKVIGISISKRTDYYCIKCGKQLSFEEIDQQAILNKINLACKKLSLALRKKSFKRN